MTDAPEESKNRSREIERLEKRIEALERDRNQYALHIAEQAVGGARLKLDESVFMHQESNKLLMKAIDVRFDRILTRIKKLTQTNEE